MNKPPVAKTVSKPAGQTRMTPAQIAEQEAFNFQFARLRINQVPLTNPPPMPMVDPGAEVSAPAEAAAITNKGGGGASTGVGGQDIQDTTGASIQDTTGAPLVQAGS